MEQQQQKKFKDTALFRKVALDRLSNPEQLDRLIQITNPRGWIALLTIGALLAGFTVWSVLGNVRTVVEGQGLLIPDENFPPEVQPVTLTETGTLTALRVSDGQTVSAGQVIAVLETDAGEIEVTSPVFGRVVEMMAQEGDDVTPDSPFMMVVAPPMLTGKIYVDFAEAQQIKPGMKVEVSPLTVPLQEFGFIPGEVLSVSEFPATDETADAFTPEGTVVLEVIVALEQAETPTGYKWSFAEGPDVPLRPNVSCMVKIVVEEERPITRIFPILG